MELSWAVAVAAVATAGLVAAKWLLKSVNVWLYEAKLGHRRLALPPGDLGWPFVGNMFAFFRAFKSTNPETFIDSYVSRYGKTGVYKAHLFGNPSVIATTAETCRKVLTDDEAFQPGWPRAAVELIGKKSFIEMPPEEHKRLRRLTSAPVNGFEALSNYIPYIEENVLASLEKWSKMGKIEFLTQLRKLTFTIIMYIFLSSESEDVMEALEKEYTKLNYGVRALRINLPGFAYHRALKARKKLVDTLQSIVSDRRSRKLDKLYTKRKDMMDALIDVEDENGRKLTDEEIIDILIMYLNAGHESSGHTMMWSTILLNQHPEVLKKAKAEQEEIVRRRPANQKGLTLRECRDMEYLSKVVDETLRYVSFSLVVFREAQMDVNLNGYLIPKGWKVLAWFRGIHYDPEIYPDPKKFDPSRWDGFIPKAGEFLPFGAGSRLCPGNDLAKLEICIFVHYFLLNYKLEWLNPEGSILFLPHSRPKDNCLAIISKNPSLAA
ncbi:ent-kaurenoic acid oxidase 1-like [Momordica charantia]|uniref:Ent-kaurenoic acid oxidase 1-like n=1 Tax=Momordica charantia TaxID=3673 RepID=A0A6J1D0Z3_MOMCH|nr:ent-kaurenoic acid oxidase 1-like [Momordica charantia]